MSYYVIRKRAGEGWRVVWQHLDPDQVRGELERLQREEPGSTYKMAPGDLMRSDRELALALRAWERGTSPEAKATGTKPTMVEVRTMLRPDALEEVEQLLRDQGFEPRPGVVIEERSADVSAMILWFAENVGAPAAVVVLTAVARWVLRRSDGRAAGRKVRAIYGPNDEVLTEVEIPREDGNSEETST